MFLLVVLRPDVPTLDCSPGTIVASIVEEVPVEATVVGTPLMVVTTLVVNVLMDSYEEVVYDVEDTELELEVVGDEVDVSVMEDEDVVGGEDVVSEVVGLLDEEVVSEVSVVCLEDEEVMDVTREVEDVVVVLSASCRRSTSLRA